MDRTMGLMKKPSSTGGDEPLLVVIHICMETTQGISLYLYLKLAKTPCFCYYLLCFFFYKNQRT
jgi:hypothetical protein